VVRTPCPGSFGRRHTRDEAAVAGGKSLRIGAHSVEVGRASEFTRMASPSQQFGCASMTPSRLDRDPGCRQL
jgi:hypothetical protein